MCWHKRIVFSVCFHSSWGPETIKCEDKEAFQAGLRKEGCHQRWSHPRDVVRIDIKCQKCVQDKQRMDERFAKVKAVIRSLREDVEAAVVIYNAVVAVGQDRDQDHVPCLALGPDDQLSAASSPESSTSGRESNGDAGDEISVDDDWIDRPRWRSRHYLPVKTKCEML